MLRSLHNPDFTVLNHFLPVTMALFLLYLLLSCVTTGRDSCTVVLVQTLLSFSALVNATYAAILLYSACKPIRLQKIF